MQARHSEHGTLDLQQPGLTWTQQDMCSALAARDTLAKWPHELL